MFLWDIAVVGGGAAGMTAALHAIRAAPNLRVAVLDGAETLGAKILVSGGGRCNVTNAAVDATDYNGASRAFIAQVLRRFSVCETRAWFDTLGVPLHAEARGKLFPDSNRARTVLEALVTDCRNRDVRLLTTHRVTALDGARDAFVLQTSQGPVRARRVVLATGGLSLPRTGSDGHGYALAARFGHALVPTTPALVPLVLDGDVHAGLAGVSLEVRATVNAGTARRHVAGPLLWTHVGVSGPVILDASRHWLRGRLTDGSASLSVRLLEGPFEAAEAWLLDQARIRPRCSLASLLAERMPASVASRMIALAGGSDQPLCTVTRSVRRAILHQLLDCILPVRDSRGYNHAEVTAGGVDASGVAAATLESRTCPGLYLAGEVLDVDGRLGGFNFQWAWASGHVAGEAAARSLT